MQRNYPGMFNLTKGLMMIAIMMMHAITDGLFGYGLNVQSAKLYPLQVMGYGSMAMFFMLCGYTCQKEIMESLSESPEGDYPALLYCCGVCSGYQSFWCLSGTGQCFGLFGNRKI